MTNGMDHARTTEPTQLQRQQRNWLWIRTALTDLYGKTNDDHQLYEDFQLWLLETGRAVYGDFRWDDQTGTARARHADGTFEELTHDQWQALLNFSAFDQWLAELEFQRRRMRMVLQQLQRLGIQPELGVHGDEYRFSLTSENVLQLLYRQLRDRLGTPGWDELDQATAEVALGVGSNCSSPQRDAAISDAADPWAAAMEFEDRRHDLGSGASPPPVDQG